MKPTRLNSDQLIAFALAHHRAGRLAEAEGIYRQLLTQEPKNARVLDLLGVLTLQSGKLEVAAGFLRRAVAADPAHANYRCNLGAALRRLGKGDEAIAEFREAVRLAPTLAVAHNNLGIALAEKLEFDEAIEAYQKGIGLDPAYAEAHSNMANALSDAGRIEEALASARRAIEIKSDDAASHNNFGVILATAGRYAEAQVAYRRAVELNPGYGDAHSNLGNALATQGKHDEALIVSRRAVELEPEALQSHWNYAVILLRSGDLAAGWREYEWRWKQQAHFPRPSPRYYPPRFPTPHWTGGDIAGRTIFLHAEQGFGDTLHFCRYAPLVAARGARVIMEVHPELCRLLKSLPGVEQVIRRGEPLPRFDEHCPVMSLPLAFNTTIESIPAQVPYLRADDADVSRWKASIESAHDDLREVARGTVRPVVGEASNVGRALPATAPPGGQCPPYEERFSGVGSALLTDSRIHENTVRGADPTKSVLHDLPHPSRKILNVGLCWAGSPKHADDKERSLSLSQLAPLASPCVRFHSLQNEEPVHSTGSGQAHSTSSGQAAAQASDPPPGMQLIDHSARLVDFAETAALIANMDLVITADTAVAHLAGALGKPVWVFLRFLSDWRWLIGRSDTPWYPTMRLFRQEKRGEWTPVVERVAKALADLQG